MSDDKQPMQASGEGHDTPKSAPQGHVPGAGGESGGGAYKHDHTETGDNREIERPVKTGKEPREPVAP